MGFVKKKPAYTGGGYLSILISFDKHDIGNISCSIDVCIPLLVDIKILIISSRVLRFNIQNCLLSYSKFFKGLH